MLLQHVCAKNCSPAGPPVEETDRGLVDATGERVSRAHWLRCPENSGAAELALLVLSEPLD